MQFLAVIAALIAMGYGFAAAGILGAITGFIASVGVGSGLAIGVGEKGTGVQHFSQRLGGVVAALGAGTGAYYGGWRFGWASAVGGYFLGMLIGFVSAALTGGLRSDA
jgi:hypothetical protein